MGYFRMSSISEAKEYAGTIRFRKRPVTLGLHTDVDGNEWDIGGIFGRDVAAVPRHRLHPYYSDTSGRSFGLVSQTWDAYKVEIVPEGNE